MGSPPLAVLYEDNHCLAVAKPARVPTVRDESGDESLLDQAKAWVKQQRDKPGDVFLAVVHRLDRPVSGVVLFARTSKGAARLSEQFRAGTVRKVYRCLVEGIVSPSQATLEDWLVKNDRTNVTTTAPPHAAGARLARLDYRTLAADPSARRTLLEVVPQTGRSHQIRVQLASRGWPIVGDRKYGSTTPMGGVIALHAAELTFAHPTRREPITVAAPSPADWPPFPNPSTWRHVSGVN